MKYIGFIIAGMIFGGFSNHGWGVWFGAVLGFLIAWVNALSHRVNALEGKLKKQSLKQQAEATQAKLNIQNATQSQAAQEPSNLEKNNVGSNEQNKSDSSVKLENVSTTENEPASVALNISGEPDLNVELQTEPDAEPEGELKSFSKENHSNDEFDVLNSTHLDELNNNQNAGVSQSSDHHNADGKFAQNSNSPSSVQRKEPKKTVKPSAFEQAITRGTQLIKDWVVGYFTGGNSLVRTGMLVLFVGVAFLLKYVAERTTVPVEVRYVGIVFGSLVMLVLGWRLRKKRPGFALSLQGGGIGVLYLTLFAAMRLHGLIPANVVILLLIAIVAFTAILAIKQDAMALAVIGIIGGFAAPILTSTGSGSHVQLFTYYLLLNLSIFGIAWFKSWRMLNLVGFIATFAVGSVWGAKFYQPQFFASVEPFLIAQFLLYVAVAVLFAYKQPPKLKGINDGTIIFGTPIVVFSLQAALVKDMQYGLAYSALALGLFYICLAYFVKFLHRPFFKDLIESFIALGVGFGTLAIPLAFDGRVTSAMWVAEASAMVWVGIKQGRMLPRFSGYALAVLGALAFFVEPAANKEVLAFLNADFIGVIIITAATAFIGLYARHHQDRLFKFETPWVSHLMLLSAVSWWVIGGLNEIDMRWGLGEYWLPQLWLLGSALVLIWASRKLAYDMLLNCALVLVLMMAWPLLLALLDRIFSPTNIGPVFNLSFLSGLLYVVAHFYLARYWLKEVASRQASITAKAARYISAILLLFSVLIWFVNGLLELNVFVRDPHLLPAVLIFISASWVLLVLFAHKLNWADLHQVKYVATPLLVYLVVFTPTIQTYHASFGLLAWLMAFGVNYWVLKVYDNKLPKVSVLFHVASLMSLSLLLMYELAQWVEWQLGIDNIWYYSAGAVILWTIIAVVFVLRNRINWPLKVHDKAYFHWALPLMMAVQWLMLIVLNWSDPGGLAGVPYLPVLNVIDLVGVASLVLAYRMQKSTTTQFFIDDKRIRYGLFAAMGFLMLNASMLRCFHYWYGIDYQLNDLLSSFMVQTGFSILWAATAVTLMVLAAKKKWRPVWLLGLGLMIVVVAKLFLVDMSASGSIERIVAFLTVGFLLSVVGYFSPLPPENKSTTIESDNQNNKSNGRDINIDKRGLGHE